MGTAFADPMRRVRPANILRKTVGLYREWPRLVPQKWRNPSAAFKLPKNVIPTAGSLICGSKNVWMCPVSPSQKSFLFLLTNSTGFRGDQCDVLIREYESGRRLLRAYDEEQQ